jgi:cytosine/adenosine deaminase-related metal-dependent hydrolase
MSEPASIAIFGSHVLTPDGVVADQWVLTQGRQIVAVTPTRPSADLVLDQPGRFVLPGLLNLHNHCFSEMVVRNRTEDGASGDEASLVYRLLMPLSRLGLQKLSSTERLAAARLGLLQVMKGGATTLLEPFRNGIPEMFQAALELGLRFYGAPYVFSSADPRMGADGRIEYGSAGNNDGATDMEEWERLRERWDGQDSGRLRLAMSPHATDTCGPDLLRAAVTRARALGVPITVHVAQSSDEVALCIERHGCTPVQYLERVGLLGPDLLAAHCIHCDADDLALLARSGSTVVNCPRTFARGGIFAPYGRFAAQGIRTVIATDGYNMDLIGELSAAGFVSKLEAGRADVATAGELLGAVTHVAADALARADLGRIVAGATADLTVVDMSHSHLQPMADPVRALVWLGHRADLDSLVVDGRLVVQDGRHLHVDERIITVEGAAAIRKVWESPEARAALTGVGVQLPAARLGGS